MQTRWFSRLYDLIMAPFERLGLRRLRQELVADARGLVLEVGAGTGLNLPHYRSAQLVVATDPDPRMLSRARPRADQTPCPVLLLVADAQRLPFPEATFDTAVATLAFCTIPDPDAAFRELRRVLKPGGELRLFEHVRSPSPRLARLQDRLTPAWSRLAGGCHLNRDTLAIARRSGFNPAEIDTSLRGLLLQARLCRL